MQFLGVAFSFPSYVPPVTAWMMHGPFANWLVKAARPRRIVELGTHYGYSYFCFCEAISAARSEADCYAVDTWAGDEHAGFYGNEVFESVARENAKYSGFSTLLRKTFSEALADIPDGTVDLLHVDGRHYYEDVKEDFESWIPKLSDRAIVLFHDTEVMERDFGIWKYWGEVSNEKTSLNLPYQHGLGVLFWGENPPLELGNFVSVLNSPTSQSLVIDQFSSAGEAFVRNYNETKTLGDRIAELNNTISLFNSKVDLLTSDVEFLSTENEALLRKIAACDELDKQTQGQITALSSQLGTIEKLLYDARKNPMSQLARLTAYKSLCLIKNCEVLLPQSSKQRLGRLIEQLDPERRDYCAIQNDLVGMDNTT